MTKVFVVYVINAAVMTGKMFTTRRQGASNVTIATSPCARIDVHIARMATAFASFVGNRFAGRMNVTVLTQVASVPIVEGTDARIIIVFMSLAKMTIMIVNIVSDVILNDVNARGTKRMYAVI